MNSDTQITDELEKQWKIAYEADHCMIDPLNFGALRTMEKKLNAANARADKLEEALRIIGDMAVVDWDDAVVGLADKSVSDKSIPSTYADRVRKLYKDAEMCEVWRARCKEAQYALTLALVPGEFCKAAMERAISARDAGKDE